MPDAELLRVIRGGIPAAGMPSFSSRLNEQQMSTIAIYLHTLQGKPEALPLPGNPEIGRTLFFNKYGCSECHMAAGQGGFIAVDLSSYANARSLDQIRDAIVNPNSSLDPNRGMAVVLTQDGQRYTGIVRNEDNFSLQLQTRDGGFHLFEKSNLASISREKRSLMPADYSSRLSSNDLNDLISYLVQIAGSQPKAQRDDSEW